MKKTHGYVRAILLSLVAALVIDMLINTETYKSGIAAALQGKDADIEAMEYTLESTPNKGKKYRLITIPSVFRLPEL